MSAGFAETLTYPIDVTKTRLQLQNELGLTAGKGAYRGMLKTGVGIYRDEGFKALYRGLPAAFIRQCVYGGIGIGFYAPIRNAICGDAKAPPLWKKVLSGAGVVYCLHTGVLVCGTLLSNF